MKLKAFWGGFPFFLSFFRSFFRNFYTQTLGEGGQDIVLFFFCPQLFFPTQQEIVCLRFIHGIE